ncbi:fibronectin type III domain-containing protein [Streptomyces nigra]|uniref:fibronectin type III domain-containing protein n=1 Tax=Streptomyces nigra TaxID=1827580 RepID=UPI00382694A0
MNPARRVTAAAATTVALATAGTLLTTATPASAAVTCTSPVFKRQFFANTSFSGTAKKTDCDSAIDQSWTGAPITGLPKDNFGVRWSVTRDFGSGGPFTLTASALDGIRVYLDGTRKIDLWKNTSTTVTKTLNLTIPSGTHTLRVDYVNWTGSAKVKFTYTPRTTASVDKTKPLAPTGAKAVYDTTTGKTKLTWTASKEMDLSGYRVYRRLKGSSTWKKLTTTTATSYTDVPPATGESYYYEIRAVDKAGNESTGSTDQPITTPDRTAPAIPTGLAATDSQPGVRLTWKTVPGATRYVVYRRWDDDGGGNPVVQVGKVTSTSWVDSTVKERLYYSYWVASVDAAGNTSAKSARAYVARDDWAPSAPVAVEASPTAGSGITVTWKASSAPVASDLSAFRIYRDGRLVDEVGSRQTSYTDTNVRHSRSYAYTVTAVDTQGQESAVSAPATAVAPATGLAPAAVSGLRGVMDEYDIVLRWQANTEEDVAAYVVYRGQLVDGAWVYEEWDEVMPWWGDETLSYSHEVWDPTGQDVRWAVAARDRAGNSLFTDGGAFSYVTVTEPVTGPPDE